MAVCVVIQFRKKLNFSCRHFHTVGNRLRPSHNLRMELIKYILELFVTEDCSKERLGNNKLSFSYHEHNLTAISKKQKEFTLWNGRISQKRSFFPQIIFTRNNPFKTLQFSLFFTSILKICLVKNYAAKWLNDKILFHKWQKDVM